MPVGAAMAPVAYEAAVTEADVVAVCPNKVVGVSRSSEMSSTTVTARASEAQQPQL